MRYEYQPPNLPIHQKELTFILSLNKNQLHEGKYRLSLIEPTRADKHTTSGRDPVAEVALVFIKGAKACVNIT